MLRFKFVDLYVVKNFVSQLFFEKIILLIMFFVIKFFLTVLFTNFSKIIGFPKIMAYSFGENIIYILTVFNFKNRVFND